MTDTTADDLPPLPEPYLRPEALAVMNAGWHRAGNVFTADQMRTYAHEARASLAAPPAPAPQPEPVNAQMLEALRLIVQWDGEGLMLTDAQIAKARAAIAAAEAAQADTRIQDAVAEAMRRQFVKLPRYSFLLDDKGNVRRVPDKSGNWVEFEAAHTLFDPVCVDAAMALKTESKT